MKRKYTLSFKVMTGRKGGKQKAPTDQERTLCLFWGKEVTVVGFYSTMEAVRKTVRSWKRSEMPWSYNFTVTNNVTGKQTIL